MQLATNPNCTRCIHFYITLDERRPRACKVFNIKGRAMPCIDVKRLTGHTCPVFEQRPNNKKKSIKFNRILDTFA
jgi:hypothetical protein